MELFEKQNKITRIQATGSKVVMSFLHVAAFAPGPLPRLSV